MSNRKQRDKNRETSQHLTRQLAAQDMVRYGVATMRVDTGGVKHYLRNHSVHLCSNCGKPGSHYCPGGFGSGGAFTCTPRGGPGTEVCTYEALQRAKAGLGGHSHHDIYLDELDKMDPEKFKRIYLGEFKPVHDPSAVA